jgi:hypothetical protein
VTAAAATDEDIANQKSSKTTKSKRKSKNGSSKHREDPKDSSKNLNSVLEAGLLSESETSCEWTGDVTNVDKHLISCHPHLAHSASWCAHQLARIQDIPRFDYLSKCFLVQNLLRRFGNHDDLQLLAQNAVVTTFRNLVTDPYYEKERFQQLSNGREFYFNDETPERASMIDQYRNDGFASLTIESREKIFEVILREYQVKHCIALLVLPYMVETTLLFQDDVVRLDQRFCGWIWLMFLNRYNSTPKHFISLCPHILHCVNHEIFRNSRTSILSLVSNVNVYARMIVLSWDMLFYASTKLEDDKFAISQCTLFYTDSMMRLTYLLRLVGNWPEIIDRTHFARFLVQSLVLGFQNFHFFPENFRGFKLMEFAVLPVMTTNHLGVFHEAVLHGGVLRYLQNQFSFFMDKLIAEEEYVSELQAKRKRKYKYAQKSPTHTVLGDRNIFNFLLMGYWILAQLFGSTNLMTSKEHVDTVYAIDTEVDNGFAALATEVNFQRIIDLTMDFLERTIRDDRYRQLNDLFVRTLFGAVTLCGQLFSLDELTDRFSKGYQFIKDASIALSDMERVMYFNLEVKLASANLVNWPEMGVGELLDRIMELWKAWQSGHIPSSGSIADPAVPITQYSWTPVEAEASWVLDNLQMVAVMGRVDFELDDEHNVSASHTLQEDGVTEGSELATTISLVKTASTFGAKPSKDDKDTSSCPSESDAASEVDVDVQLEKMKRYRYKQEEAIFAKLWEGIDMLILDVFFPRHSHMHISGDAAQRELYLCPLNCIKTVCLLESERGLILRNWIYASTHISCEVNRTATHSIWADTGIIAVHRLLFDTEEIVHYQSKRKENGDSISKSRSQSQRSLHREHRWYKINASLTKQQRILKAYIVENESSSMKIQQHLSPVKIAEGAQRLIAIVRENSECKETLLTNLVHFYEALLHDYAFTKNDDDDEEEDRYCVYFPANASYVIWTLLIEILGAVRMAAQDCQRQFLTETVTFSTPFKRRKVQDAHPKPVNKRIISEDEIGSAMTQLDALEDKIKQALQRLQWEELVQRMTIAVADSDVHSRSGDQVKANHLTQDQANRKKRKHLTLESI